MPRQGKPLEQKKPGEQKPEEPTPAWKRLQSHYDSFGAEHGERFRNPYTIRTCAEIVRAVGRKAEIEFKGMRDEEVLEAIAKHGNFGNLVSLAEAYAKYPNLYGNAVQNATARDWDIESRKGMFGKFDNCARQIFIKLDNARGKEGMPVEKQAAQEYYPQQILTGRGKQHPDVSWAMHLLGSKWVKHVEALVHPGNCENPHGANEALRGHVAAILRNEPGASKISELELLKRLNSAYALKSGQSSKQSAKAAKEIVAQARRLGKTIRDNAHAEEYAKLLKFIMDSYGISVPKTVAGEPMRGRMLLLSYLSHGGDLTNLSVLRTGKLMGRPAFEPGSRTIANAIERKGQMPGRERELAELEHNHELIRLYSAAAHVSTAISNIKAAQMAAYEHLARPAILPPAQKKEKMPEQLNLFKQMDKAGRPPQNKKRQD